MSLSTAKPNETTLFFLERFAKERAPLRLTRMYKGILLEQPVHVLNVYVDYADFQASDIKALMEPSGHVYLHDPILPAPIQAQLMQNDINHCAFTLTDFCFMDKDWKDRSAPRVQPKRPTYVHIRWKQDNLTGSLCDLQISNLGVLANRLACEQKQIQPGAQVQLRFTIGLQFTWSELKGEVHYLQPLSHTITRLGIHIFPTPSQLVLLNRYMALRQDEILNELDDAYGRAFGPRRIEELFF